MHDDIITAKKYEASAESFRRSVNKLCRILGMQAENDQRKAVGASMAYTEADFSAVERDGA